MIKCHEHDYIEITCLYQYPIRMELKSGEILQGIAIDTERNETRAKSMESCKICKINGVRLH